MSGVRELRAQRALVWSERMARQVARAGQLPSPPVEGSLTRMVGLAWKPPVARRPSVTSAICSTATVRASKPKSSASPATNCFSCPRARCMASRPPRAWCRASAPAASASGPVCSAASSTARACRSTASAPSRPTNASSCWGRPSIRWSAIPSTRRSMWACARSMRC